MARQLRSHKSLYATAEDRSIKERRKRAITKPQAEIMLKASDLEWRTRRQMDCTESGARSLVRAGIFLSKLDGVEMVYKLKKDF
jgi:hypothetical protein